MFKSLLIALTIATQPITPDVAFDLGYKVGVLNCKYIVPGQIDSDQALNMAVQSLTNEEKKIVTELNNMNKSAPILKIHLAGYEKGLSLCKDQL